MRIEDDLAARDHGVQELPHAVQELPHAIFHDGRVYYLDNDTWMDAEGTAEQLEAAAQNRMGVSGPEAIAKLVQAIEQLGPRIGSEIIRQGLNRVAAGPGAQNWTILFRYAWRHHGILRYMSRPDGKGRSRYCTLAQAMQFRTH